MFTEEQKHYTGRAMIALAGMQRGMLEAVQQLVEFAPEEAVKIADRMSRDADMVAGLLRLAVAAAPSEPLAERVDQMPARERM